ncbi:MAG: shikimate dehydrogenase [Alteromonadaceae bacterium]|nr:MAG: shikimate dehydrogenase [Alteromonadaceae bacterium]
MKVSNTSANTSENTSATNTADSAADPACYAVFGNPIAQSKSPDIHLMFAAQTDQNIHYSKILVEVDQFVTAADKFFGEGGQGLNITMPFKLDAYNYAHELSDRARTAGAVNTLAKQSDGVIIGDNTDGIGMVSDITQRLGWVVRDRRVLVLGAGGAVRGVLLPLIEQAPKSLLVANRTASKAEDLAQKLADYGELSACGYEQLDGSQFDVIINGTSASLGGALPALPASCIHSKTCVYDMVYSKTSTPFLDWSGDQGATQLSDGLGMLVGQAAESFFIWRKVRPEVAPVLAFLQEQA